MQVDSDGFPFKPALCSPLISGQTPGSCYSHLLIYGYIAHNCSATTTDRFIDWLSPYDIFDSYLSNQCKHCLDK